MSGILNFDPERQNIGPLNMSVQLTNTSRLCRSINKKKVTRRHMGTNYIAIDSILPGEGDGDGEGCEGGTNRPLAKSANT